LEFLFVLGYPAQLLPIVFSNHIPEILAVSRRNSGESNTNPTWRVIFFGAERI
jgi:hypothetical protein